MRKQRIFALLVIISVIAADQLTKLLSLSFLAPESSVTVIPNVLEFRYVENRGAAFGILSEHRWVFMILTAVAVVAMLLWVMLKKSSSKLLTTAIVLVVAGGIGNMIDRIFRGFVIDFINAIFVKFYVFNIADCAVVIGCGLMILYVLIDVIKSRQSSEPKE